MKKKNIEKMLREAGILIGVFIIAVLIFGYFTNRDEDNMAADMGNATYPQVFFGYNGYTLNSMPGYKKEMDIVSVRDTITPVYEGKLDVMVDRKENEIENISYKIYTLDGKEVLQQKEQKASKEFTINLEDERLLSEERVLQIILQLKGDVDIYFYTRIANSDNANVLECLNYVKDFHENALGKKEDTGIGKAIEPNEEGDNTTFSHVTIHSDYNHVTWGELEPRVEGGEQWSVKEMNDTSSSYQVEFRVRCKGEENDEDIYKVREFYRVRYDKRAQKIYLLDYDRTMEQIFDPTKKVLGEKGLLLGIANQDIPYMTDKKGKIVSFVQADELWMYHKETNEISKIFSFASAENTDERNMTDQHEIRLIKTENNGNVTFAVYGYMNRGEHEGEVGVAVYYYDIAKNAVEEKVFIPTNKSYRYAVNELGELIYYSTEENQLYILVNGIFYKTDVKKGRTKELVRGLEENQYVVSDDGHILAYQIEEDASSAREITVMNLSSGEARTVACGENESIQPLGFIRNDFVYGVAKTADAGKTVSGESVIPMYKVEIQNSKGKVVKTYEQEGIYILGAELNVNRVVLKRAKRESDAYTVIEEEYISNNEEPKENNIYLESYATELKERQVRIVYNDDDVSDKEPKVLKPKQIAAENPVVVTFEYQKETKKYYTYGYGSLQGVYDNAGDAIVQADQFGGVVTDQNQSYIWVRGNRDLKYTIKNAESIAAGIKAKLAAGTTPVEIMDSQNPGGSLNLTGCSVEQLAYIINQDKPVIAMLNANDAVVLVGYGDSTMTYIDMSSEGTKTISFEEMDNMTAGSGHIYIA